MRSENDLLQPTQIGQNLSGPSGILDLMQDLGDALAQAREQTSGEAIAMLGGGNPAHIPDVEAAFRKRWLEIADEPGALEHLLGDYDPPAGKHRFRETIATYLNEQFDWDLTAHHVAITSGSQAAYFSLFNILAGELDQGKARIAFPLVPEYIGYADQALSNEALFAWAPKITRDGTGRFHYSIDWEQIEGHWPGNIAALCLSRPTNPTARCAQNEEIKRLLKIAEENDCYLMLDNAYGLPFPGVVFSEKASLPQWNRNLICSFSLSKLGLPTTRTGIIVAEPQVISAVIAANARIGLANGSIGQGLIEPMLRSGQVDRLCSNVIRPYYHERCQQALQFIDHIFQSQQIDYAVHIPGGAFFLWLWLPNLAISDQELYEILKSKGVLVVPGHHFFFGLPPNLSDWRHRQQCLRLSYCAPWEQVQRGITIIAESVRKFSGASTT